MINKSLIFIYLLCSLSFAQQTFVPDDNFEQGLIDLGYDSGPLDDFVPTQNIEGIFTLFLENKGIVDMTGIEDFTNLELIDLTGNEIQTLDLSQNSNLERIDVYNNNLNELNIAHGNLYNMLSFNAQLNSNLACIEVDDEDYATNNFQFIDSQTQFSENCESLSTNTPLKTNLSIYPNPFTSHFYLTGLSESQAFKLFDIRGQLVLDGISKGFTLKLDVSSIRSGVYMLKIGDFYQKLIKQ